MDAAAPTPKQPQHAQRENENLAAHFEFPVSQPSKARASKNLVDRILAAVPVGVVFLDKGLVVRWVNQQFAVLDGRSADDLLGEDFSCLFPDTSNWRSELTELVQSSTPLSHRLPGQFVSGSQAWNMLAVPLIGSANALEGVILATDLAGTPGVESLRDEAIRRLEESNRLKRDQISVISHELRTPIALIRGHAELLQDKVGGQLNEVGECYLREILSSSNRMHQIVEDLLDIRRIELGILAIRKSAEDICSLISEVVVNFAPQFLAAFLKAGYVPGEPTIVDVDGNRIRQVLARIISNAIKFTPENGKVSISVRRVKREAVVEVADSGIGIPADKIPHMFEEFYQADQTSTRETGGTGLGLYLCKHLVEAHGGRIGLMSEEGKGTTVWFTLPLAEPPEGRS